MQRALEKIKKQREELKEKIKAKKRELDSLVEDSFLLGSVRFIILNALQGKYEEGEKEQEIAELLDRIERIESVRKK